MNMILCNHQHAGHTVNPRMSVWNIYVHAARLRWGGGGGGLFREFATYLKEVSC